MNCPPADGIPVGRAFSFCGAAPGFPGAVLFFIRAEVD